jgi:hypothetical protein
MASLKAFFWRATITAAAIGGLTVAVLAIPVNSPGAGAEAWAASLTASERLAYGRTDRLASLPSDYRRALARAATSAEERVAFWQATFANFRRHRTLTEAQDAVVREAEALIPAAFAANVEKSMIAEKLAGVRTRLVSTLGDDVANELLRATGSARTSSQGLPFVERVRYSWRVNRPNKLLAAISYVFPTVEASSSCNCGSQGDCYWEQTCGLPEGYSCDPYEPPICGLGCGDWGCYGCWMFCYYPR